MTTIPIRRALLSVSDKTGIVDLGRALAAKGVDRFANVDWEHSDSGAVFISGSSAWLECDIARIVEAGDHHLVLLTILAQSSSPDTEPLVFHRSAFGRLSEPA